MLSIAKIRGPLIMAMFPLQKYTPHIKSTDKPADTPMERIKRIFLFDEMEFMSKELRFLKSLTVTAGGVGGFIGGMINIQGSVEKFIDNNQATRFYNVMDGKKMLHRAVLLEFAKGFFKYSWRAGFFTAIFGSIQLLLMAYYGEAFVWHYVAGGSIAGFLYKMSLGIRGSLVGLIVGGILGAINGFLTLYFLQVTGVSLVDLQNLGQDWAYSSEEKFKEQLQRDLSDELKEAKILYDLNKDIHKQLSVEEDVKKEKN